MHQYLRAVGFSEPPRRIEIYNFIRNGIAGTPAYRAYTTNVEEEDSLLAQYDIALGDNIGISVCGQFDETDEFYPEYYYPYLNPSGASTIEEITVERRLDNNSFSGIVDDYCVGVSLIYRLRNSIDYIKYSHMYEDPLRGATTSLSALSLEGRILLPIYKTEEETQRSKDNARNRLHLMQKAHDGDEKAYQSLAIADMDTYTNIVTQFQSQESADVYSLVESYLMPAGAECELYNILAEILQVRTTTNRLTNEEVVILTVSCNMLQMDIAISRRDLLGEPAVGRRFKGRIWLQGSIHFAGEGEV